MEALPPDAKPGTLCRPLGAETEPIAETLRDFRRLRGWRLYVSFRLLFQESGCSGGRQVPTEKADSLYRLILADAEAWEAILFLTGRPPVKGVK